MKTLKKKLLSKTLGKHAYWTLNKSLVQSIGLESTLILQHIIDLQDAFDKDEIFQSQPEMAKELGISEYAVKNRIPELIKLEIINVVKKGVPCKNYYSTNDAKIIEILLNGLDSTKSTDLIVDSNDELKSTDSDTEINLSVDTKSTDSDSEINPQLVSNQLTGDTEIVSTITKNTTNNTTNNDLAKNTYKQYAEKETATVKPLYNSEFDPSVFDDPIFLNSLKK